jgi:hypothetical protein
LPLATAGLTGGGTTLGRVLTVEGAEETVEGVLECVGGRTGSLGAVVVPWTVLRTTPPVVGLAGPDVELPRRAPGLAPDVLVAGLAVRGLEGVALAGVLRAVNGFRTGAATSRGKVA